MESQQEQINKDLEQSQNQKITVMPKKRGRPLGKKDTKKRAPYKKRNNDNTTIQ